MKNVFHGIHRHITHHHKKYLLGIFGGYAVVKLFLLLLGFFVIEYNTRSGTFANLEDGCFLTGQYYTGEYQIGGYLTGQELTVGYMTGCTTVPGYRTGGTLDESGTLIGQTRVEESQIGCELIGQELTGGYMTGYTLTGGYRTGGYITGCLEVTGTVETGTPQIETTQSGNGVCESGDIIWNAPLSGSVVGNIVPISWSYSGTDCLSELSLQLRDHNNQWINLATIPSGTTGYLFDSKRLYSFQQSGFYHIIGTGTSGQYYLYTGIATGTYSRLFSGYMLRLLTSNGTPLYETSPFVINNETPTLTGMSLLANGSASGYVPLSGTVVLNFTASQFLSGVQVTLGSDKVPTSSSVSGLVYTSTRTISSGYTEGPLVASIAFTDAFGNITRVVYTGSIIFDTTYPIVTGFIFSGTASGVYLNFTSSESVRYTLSAQKTGGNSTGITFITGVNTEYLTAQQYFFSSIARDQIYKFTLSIYDRAGNMRSVTGDVLQTSLGTVLSHVFVIPLTTTVQETALSGTLATLGVTLRAEIDKFTVCKEALTYFPVAVDVKNTTFTIQMPMFEKAQMKPLVNAFALFILDKIKHDYAMTSGNIDELTKKFDNFLIILKLLRDDDNVCKQNLSNYHINQFKRALEEFKIDLK